MRAGHHHYTQLPGMPRLRAAMAKISTRCTGVETRAQPGHRHAGRPVGALRRRAGARSTRAITRSSSRPITPPIRAPSAPPGRLHRRRGARRRRLPADAPTAIETAIQPNTRAILINTPNNPTGAVYTRASLEGIAGVCRDHDLWLLSDEVYWTLGGGEHVSPRALPGMAERTLVINSMSKSHGMTGWRIGWLTGPEEMITLLISLNLVTTYGLHRLRLARRHRGAGERLWRARDRRHSTTRRRTLFLDAIRGVNDVDGARL